MLVRIFNKVSSTPGRGQPHLVQFVSTIYYIWRRGWLRILVESVSSAGTRRRSVHTWRAWRCFLRRTTLSRLRVSPSVTEQMKAIFLAEVGPEVYSVLSNLLSPVKPKDTSLADIVQTLKNHYDPAPLEITEAFTSACEINKRMSRLVITLWLEKNCRSTVTMGNS